MRKYHGTKLCVDIIGLYVVRRKGQDDNPTINSSIVRYDSNCSHKPRGTSKPTFSSTNGYFPLITSISKI